MCYWNFSWMHVCGSSIHYSSFIPLYNTLNLHYNYTVCHQTLVKILHVNSDDDVSEHWWPGCVLGLCITSLPWSPCHFCQSWPLIRAYHGNHIYISWHLYKGKMNDKSFISPKIITHFYSFTSIFALDEICRDLAQ